MASERGFQNRAAQGHLSRRMRVIKWSGPGAQWAWRRLPTGRWPKTVRQLGLYAKGNGFRIERAGVIKAHNGLVCRVR